MLILITGRTCLAKDGGMTMALSTESYSSYTQAERDRRIQGIKRIS